MFLDLFYGLRKEGVPVSIQEWRMLMTALERGLHGSNLLSSGPSASIPANATL